MPILFGIAFYIVIVLIALFPISETYKKKETIIILALLWPIVFVWALLRIFWEIVKAIANVRVAINEIRGKQDNLDGEM